MINTKYKKIYDEFINKYKEIHINPWHQITKKQLTSIYDGLVNSMDIDNKYNFKYFIDYIIKRLSGSEDAHTKYQCVDCIPLNFRKFNDDILINYPNDLKGYILVSISNVSINQIIKELEDVITYGTAGKRDYEIEKSLFNKITMFGLPSFRNSSELIYELLDSNGNVVQKKITRHEKYDNLFDYDKYLYGNIAEYKIIDNCLVYNHSSIQNKFKNIIEKSINKLETEDLSNVDTIIIDLRGNLGGNSALNKTLIDYLKTQSDKKLICLTDYRVFSGGRYALRDLINLGATTIGEEIGTSINCYGNSNWVNLDNHYFSVSECYFHPFIGVSASSKEEFNEIITDEIRKPYIFHPDIEVKETKEDYLNGIDTILNYALKYSKIKNQTNDFYE